jgi:hypothetical protein
MDSLGTSVRAAWGLDLLGLQHCFAMRLCDSDRCCPAAASVVSTVLLVSVAACYQAAGSQLSIGTSSCNQGCYSTQPSRALVAPHLQQRCIDATTASLTVVSLDVSACMEHLQPIRDGPAAAIDRLTTRQHPCTRICMRAAAEHLKHMYLKQCLMRLESPAKLLRDSDYSGQTGSRNRGRLQRAPGPQQS